MPICAATQSLCLRVLFSGIQCLDRVSAIHDLADSQGGVIPAAMITLNNQENGLTRSPLIFGEFQGIMDPRTMQFALRYEF